MASIILNRLRVICAALAILFVATAFFYSAPAFGSRYRSATVHSDDPPGNTETLVAPELPGEEKQLDGAVDVVSTVSPPEETSVVEEEASVPETHASDISAVETPGIDTYDDDQVSHDEISHDEVSHDEISHDEVSHDEDNHNEVSHDEDNHNEDNHNEVNDDEINHDEVNHDEGNHDADDTPNQTPPEPAARISRMHYLIPASKTNIRLCMNLASSAANRYPVPSILGYHGTGRLDAATTHLAKLRAVDAYLNSLGPTEKGEDDDLVLIVDGYDILLQLPPEVMIERYFEIVNGADARIARRLGISVEEARARGLHDTIIWGPDKICWPIDKAAPRCWAAPASSLSPGAFGPKSGNGEMKYNDPRWLNSGTVVGPLGHLRTLIAATMREIDATYDPNYEFAESDQYYISNIWGRQEYFRFPAAGPRLGEADEAANVGGGGGPRDHRRLPTTRPADPETEYHIGIDYESALFQTKGGYEPFFGYLQFSRPGLHASMDVDMFAEGDGFAPRDIGMPAGVYSALGRLFDSIAASHPGTSTYDWMRTVKLSVNYVTGHIFTLWHCTGPKEPVVDEYPSMWFFPYAASLVKATVRAFQGGELITNHLVDGRKWAPKNRYPDRDTMSDELGGAWTDLNGGQFVEWHELCGEYALQLFGGEQPP